MKLDREHDREKQPTWRGKNIQKLPKKWLFFGGLALLGLVLALLITGSISQAL